jgi:hypothetical protein
MRFAARVFVLVLLAAAAAGDVSAQSKTRKPAAKPKAAPALKAEPAKLTCPAQLGTGLKTRRVFCDVLTGRTTDGAVAVEMPARTGPATLLFDLHNRQTYSEQQVRAGKAFADYVSTVAVVGPDGALLGRAAAQASFRTAADLFDRVGGGAGPGGMKAVAPVGAEPVRVEVPAGVARVFVLGERLVVETLDGRDAFTAAGRPVAIVSNVRVEYRPVPPKPARKSTTRKRTP